MTGRDMITAMGKTNVLMAVITTLAMSRVAHAEEDSERNARINAERARDQDFQRSHRPDCLVIRKRIQDLKAAPGTAGLGDAYRQFQIKDCYDQHTDLGMQEEMDRFAAGENAEKTRSIFQQHKDQEAAKKRERDEKLAAEQKQQAEDQAAEQKRFDAMRDNPKVMAIAWGATFCSIRQVRSDALEEISKEKKYGRIGGMVDKEKLYSLQKQVRWADETEAKERKELTDEPKRYRVTPLPCSSPLVKIVLECVADTGACVDGHARDLAAFVPHQPDDE